MASLITFNLLTTQFASCLGNCYAETCINFLQFKSVKVPSLFLEFSTFLAWCFTTWLTHRTKNKLTLTSWPSCSILCLINYFNTVATEAWVTLATNDSYAVGVLVLAHSLQAVQTTRPLVVMVGDHVSPAMRFASTSLCCT